MEMERRDFLKLGAGALTWSLVAEPAWAQTNKIEVHWLGQSTTACHTRSWGCGTWTRAMISTRLLTECEPTGRCGILPGMPELISQPRRVPAAPFTSRVRGAARRRCRSGALPHG